MKIIFLSIISLSLLSFSEIEKSDILGKYKFAFTQDASKNLLIKANQEKSIPFDFGRFVTFSDDCTFTDTRNAPCGNDLFWTINGKYTLRDNILTMKYRKGEVSDRTGAKTPATYQNANMKYKIEMKGDTIVMNRLNSEDFLVRE